MKRIIAASNAKTKKKRGGGRLLRVAIVVPRGEDFTYGTESPTLSVMPD